MSWTIWLAIGALGFAAAIGAAGLAFGAWATKRVSRHADRVDELHGSLREACVSLEAGRGEIKEAHAHLTAAAAALDEERDRHRAELGILSRRLEERSREAAAARTDDEAAAALSRKGRS